MGIHINDESICSMSKSYNLESLEKFTSDTTPDKELLATDKAIKFGSFQILSGRVPFIDFYQDLKMLKMISFLELQGWDPKLNY